MTDTTTEMCPWIAGIAEPKPEPVTTLDEAIDWIEAHNPGDSLRYYIGNFCGAMFPIGLSQMRKVAEALPLWDGAEITLFAWDSAPWLVIRHKPSDSGIEIRRFDG